MSTILKEVEKIILNIKRAGNKINNTMEITNPFSTFYPHRMNLEEEEKEIAEVYNGYIGDWTARQELEKNHYKFLTSFLIHKMGEVQYFHKDQNLTSRKFVIWSADCIASIQFLSRPDKNILNIFVRSSDSFNLLLSDYLFGCKLLNSVLEEFNIKKNDKDEVNFFTTSCHFYIKDEDKINNFLNRKNKKLDNFIK